MASSKKVRVKFLVAKEESQVVLAESNKDFVDILFSFLTMPLGTVIRILGNKSSSLGSLVNIYRSVENLESQNLQTEACKTMLLRPRNSSEVKCEDLVINVDDAKPRTFYTCKNCIAKSRYFYSSIPDTRCNCGQLMSQITEWQRTDKIAHEDGVFVNGKLWFFITDDLNVASASAAILTRTFKIMEIEDAGKLEERNLEFGPEEVVNLLWRALISKNPLTDLCFNTPEDEISARGHMKDDAIQPKHESESSDADRDSKKIKLKLVLNKNNNKLLFAEADSDLVDLLFSWLTFPLGLVMKHAKDIQNGCIMNLSNSLECNGLMKSEECKSMLLSPKLAPFHGCSNQLLYAEEMVSKTRHVPGCNSTKKIYSQEHGRYYDTTVAVEFHELNPKSPTNGTGVGGGYAQAFRKYMVTDDLRILPLSLHSYVQILRDFKTPARSLVEREVSLGANQAADLLRVAFDSRTALSDVFPPAKKWLGPHAV